MPIDLTPNQAAGIIQVRDRAGTGLPFSKGLMATSILATGVATEIAYRIAASIERALRDQGKSDIDAEELVELAADTITQSVGEEVAERYRAWRRAKRTGRPVFVALGGAPGVGKSTLATRLAVRLGITRIVTTDTIREVLRTVIPKTVLPELHLSTYETAEDELTEDQPLQSFRRQARAVGAATGAVARRLASERRGAIIEGVHMLPGQMTRELAEDDAEPIIVEMLLTLDDESLHRAHLTARLHGEPARGGDRHLNHFASIRLLQQTLYNHAAEAKVTQYDIADPQDLTQRILDQIVAEVDTPAQRETEAA